MTSPLELEIRSRAAQVLAGEILPRDFYSWFIPASLDVADDSSLEAALTHTIVHLFSELTSGDITPRQFKKDLRLAASTYRTIRTPWHREVGIPVTTSDANATLEADFTVLDLRRHAAAVA